MRKLILSMALVGMVSFAAAANAGMSEEKSVVVNLAGIDVSSQTGQVMAYDRLQRAARKVCGHSDLRTTGSLNETQNAKACYAESLDNAVEQLGVAAIRKIHSLREG